MGLEWCFRLEWVKNSVFDADLNGERVSTHVEIITARNDRSVQAGGLRTNGHMCLCRMSFPAEKCFHSKDSRKNRFALQCCRSNFTLGRKRFSLPKKKRTERLGSLGTRGFGSVWRSCRLLRTLGSCSHDGEGESPSSNNKGHYSTRHGPFSLDLDTVSHF